jgi:tetratricopeptide (TPR) repeat protein
LSRRLVSDGPPQTRAGAPDAVGNTYFVLGEFHPALDQYTQVLGFSPDDYYALASAAQSYQALGDPVAADFFARCLSAIERSGDLRRKRERNARALIVAIAAQAARSSGDQTRYEQYAREAREILGGNLAVDGMSPKFFSPTTKRLVSSAELLREIAEPQQPAAASS